MAIDPEKYDNFRNQLDELVEAAPVPDKQGTALTETLLGDAIDEMDELIEESRPPRIYIFGRSGAGKSSLINALSNKEEQVAEVGAVEPTTVESEVYHISFPNRHASWEVIDSRGLFESVAPDGEVPTDTVEQMREDLKEHRPDILLHVMTPDQVRAGEEDFETVTTLRNELEDELGREFPPILYCLNKVDIHLSPTGDWPPESNPSLASFIKEKMDQLADILGESEKTPFKDANPLYGYKFDSTENIGVVPLHLQAEPYWNVRTLSWLMSDFLPKDARLQFNQAQRRQGLMREMSRDVTNKFATTAAGVGAAPAPVADIAVLIPLQYALVGLVGAFSCSELEPATANEYVGSMGGTTLAGFAARSVARSLIQVVPGAGTAVSTAVAGGTTWAIGRSAEHYFFDDEEIKPAELKAKGKSKFEDEEDGTEEE